MIDRTPCFYPYPVLFSSYMHKKIVVGIVIFILILLGAGGMYVMTQKSVKAPAPPAPTAEPTKATAAEAKGTIKSLLASGVPQSCTFTSEKQASTSGTVYIAGGKMRGDFTTTSQGQSMTGHLIIDSGYSYIWSDLLTRGMKVALTEGSASATTANQGMDVNQSVSYTCKPWTPDASKFTLPTNITFTAITVPGAAAPGTTGTAPSACTACASLTGTAQSACKAQFNCK
jgi:hypothetical protein